MNRAAQRKIEAAERAAEKLAKAGLHIDAEAVRALARAYRASNKCNSTLHAENKSLRKGAPCQT